MQFAEGWNFGPLDEDARPVEWIVQRLCKLWGDEAQYLIDAGDHPHEAHYLKLDCSKVHAKLGWRPRWGLEKALESIVDWNKTSQHGGNVRDMCIQQIEDYSNSEVLA